jgi:hypothetical protein
MILLGAIGALALAVPAVSLAGGGSSAGDQQYVDPLSGSSHHSTTTTASPATPTPAPVASASSSTPTATATAATSTTAATGSSSASKQLPFTGMNVWLAAGIGLLMLGAGVGIRRAVRQRA